MTKKKYFEDKIDGVQKAIWDMEFKRFKSAELYEEARELLENQKSRKAALEVKIESEKNTSTMEKGEIARLDDEMVKFNRDIERQEGVMKSIDIEMHGCKPCAEYPDGLSGVDQTIDALHELVGMIKEYIKQI